jgi:hypothetical protein
VTTGSVGDAVGILGTDWDPNPSTNRLVFTARTGNVWRGFEVSADGGAPIQLIYQDPGLDAHSLKFTVDGTSILLKRNAPFNNYSGNIFVADPQGGNVQPLTNLPGYAVDWPVQVFESGVPKIVYARFIQTYGSEWQLWKMNADGTCQVAITAIDGVRDGVRETYPVAPRGTVSAELEATILFTVEAGGATSIWKMRTDGSGDPVLVIEDATQGYWWVPPR